MRPRMLFHYPFPIPTEGISGSTVRVPAMLHAFEKLGYEVFVVDGYAGERRQKIAHAREQVACGRGFDFVYSESSTLPSLLAKNSISQPLLDYGFFRWCRKQSIPVGLFLRDIHWRFGLYGARAGWARRAISIPLYWYDWFLYRRFVDHLFVPSLEMAEALPTRWPADRISALPPGCLPCPVKRRTVDVAPQVLRMFYVGGVTPPLYDLKPMIETIAESEKIVLTLCCREKEWERARGYYGPLDAGEFNIVHAHGKDLCAYYASSDLFGLAWRPNEYLRFAMPAKIFEALGYGMPIVTTTGTSTADFVAREGIGWVVSTTDELRELLAYLKANPQVIAEKRKHLEAVRERHTWLVRAQTVVDVLTKGKR